MRIAAPFRPDLAPYEAFAASLRVWLVELLAWFAEALEPPASRRPSIAARILAPFAPQIRADLRQVAFHLRRILFLMAFVRINLPALVARTKRPGGAPSGFRRSMPIFALRQLTGDAFSGLNSGSLVARARRLKRMLDNPEPTIARIVAHLLRLLRRASSARLFAIAPPPVRFTSAPTPPPAHADTS